jgi:hypothetical protein
MSVLTYPPGCRVATGKASHLAERAGEDASVLDGSAGRGGLLAQTAAGRSRTHDAALTSDAEHRHPLPRQDKDRTWRIVYRVDSDAVVIAEVFAKTSQATPKQVMETSRRRFRQYDEITGER